jgi:DNA-directed RNA polymerase specialized sigma24 family protein
MTAADIELRTVLASPLLRRKLTALVSRRVPSEAAEDVVQSVLCDALAADPPERDALGKWLFGIARHKVADFHRRSKHWDQEIEVLVEPDPIEARDILQRAIAIAPDRHALEWIVRVESGERFEDIAREERIPAPAVRKRVSRLRRVLRAALLVAAALTIVLVARMRAVEPIAPEPTPGGTLDGRWRVVSVDCRTESASCIAARHASVLVRGDNVTITMGASTFTTSLHELHVASRGAQVVVESDLGTATLERE